MELAHPVRVNIGRGASPRTSAMPSSADVVLLDTELQVIPFFAATAVRHTSAMKAGK